MKMEIKANDIVVLNGDFHFEKFKVIVAEPDSTGDIVLKDKDGEYVMVQKDSVTLIPQRIEITIVTDANGVSTIVPQKEEKISLIDFLKSLI
jgi:hypothetical protein